MIPVIVTGVGVARCDCSGQVVSGPDVLLFRLGFALSQRLSGQGQPVVALHDPVEHGVGHGGFPDPLMPVLDGQL